MNNTMEVAEAFTELSNPMSWGLVLIIGLILLVLMYKIYPKKKVIKTQETIPNNNKICNHNFNKVGGLYCSKCGKRRSKQDD